MHSSNTFKPSQTHRSIVMNTRHLVLAVVATLSLPVAGYAQESGSTVTRAQVRAELVQLEHAGYRPGLANDPHYPADIQSAEAAVQQHAGSNLDSGVGGVHSGSSGAGSRVTVRVPVNSIYAHR
jgi:hypothetical protein